MSSIDAPTGPQNLLRGVSLILISVFVISVQDVIFKLFSTQLTLWQIFAVRGMLALVLLFALATMQGNQRNVLLGALNAWVLARSMFMTIALMAFYAALPFLSLSTAGAANYIAPIFVTVLSAWVILEPVGRLGWVGVCIGFAGALVLLQPGGDAFSLWVLSPLMGAGFYALAHVTTRSKCLTVPVAAMAFSLSLVMMCAGLVVSGVLLLWQAPATLALPYPYIFGTWATVGVFEWAVLAMLAVFSVVIAATSAGAYQAAPPAKIATFEYCYLIFVVLWDYLFFATTASGATLLGMGMIVIAGMMVLRRRS
jgi:drug/metabolite transporter (DMT)-like permease